MINLEQPGTGAIILDWLHRQSNVLGGVGSWRRLRAAPPLRRCPPPHMDASALSFPRERMVSCRRRN